MRDDIKIVVADSSFTSITKLCNEVAKRQYKLPKFILSLASYFVRKKIKKKANFDINDCDTLSAFKEGSFRPSILFLAAKGDSLIHYNHSVELFTTYKGPKNILIFEGNHNSKRPKHILNEISMNFRKLLPVDKLPEKVVKEKLKNVVNDEIPGPKVKSPKSKVTQIKIKSKDNNDLSGFESDND